MLLAKLSTPHGIPFHRCSVCPQVVPPGLLDWGWDPSFEGRAAWDASMQAHSCKQGRAEPGSAVDRRLTYLFSSEVSYTLCAADGASHGQCISLPTQAVVAWQANELGFLLSCVGLVPGTLCHQWNTSETLICTPHAYMHTSETLTLAFWLWSWWCCISNPKHQSDSSAHHPSQVWNIWGIGFSLTDKRIPEDT